MPTAQLKHTAKDDEMRTLDRSAALPGIAFFQMCRGTSACFAPVCRTGCLLHGTCSPSLFHTIQPDPLPRTCAGEWMPSPVRGPLLQGLGRAVSGVQGLQCTRKDPCPPALK